MRDKKVVRKVLVFGIVFVLFFVAFAGIPVNVSAAKPLFAGGDGTPGNPYQISNVNHLQNIKYALTAHYILIKNIDASRTRKWNNGAGFEPIGIYNGVDHKDSFKGDFDGKGYKITDLYINPPSTEFLGLFGFITGANIKNVGLENIVVSGYYMTVYGGIGGLVGYNEVSSISNSYSTGTVSGNKVVGGLVGMNFGGSISNSYATSTVSGNLGVGGLAGFTLLGSISNSYATGTVSGNSDAGGLVGLSDGIILNSHATGAVSGGNNIGGLVGYTSYDTIISNSYATGSVSGNWFVGGLVGNNRVGSISNSYATGTVSGNSYVGGMVGFKEYGSVSNSYWDIETSGQTTSDGGTGKTTAEMKQQATFVGWDFTNTWDIVEDITYPFFRWQDISPETIRVVIINDYIQTLPDGAFNPKVNPEQKKQRFNDMLNDVIEMIGAGEYQTAIDTLQNDIRIRFDGTQGGNPKNDWITDLDAQADLCSIVETLVAYLQTLV